MDQLIRDQQPLGESRPRGPVCGLSVNSVSLSALSPLLSPPHLAPCLVPAGGSVACHPESARGASLGQWGDNGQSPTQQESRGWGVYSHRRLGAGRDQRPWPRDDGDVHAAQGESTARRAAGAGTRGSQAAASLSVLVVLLLLKLGHQAEFTAAAALGQIQHHVLWGKRKTPSIRPRLTKTPATPRPGRRKAKKDALFRVPVVAQGKRI